MGRAVKHLSLHRIAGTELRVVGDVEDGALQVVQEEETVIRGYAGHDGPETRLRWPHRSVTLFVLEDLDPLIRQLTSLLAPPPDQGEGWGGGANLPPGGVEALSQRPVVNVYDLAEPVGCHIFVNRQAMAKAGYWEDPLAVRALLAHEHAHPLAENDTTRASRQSRVELSLADSGWEIADSRQRPSAVSYRPLALLTLLADKLCLYAPREILANEVTIRSGFGQALLHLDQRTVAQAARSVAGRRELRRRLQQEVAQGSLTPQAADQLLLIGDLKGYLDLALEVAAFYRTDMEREAKELEVVLEWTVFPYLGPQVGRAYAALREQYTTLRADLTEAELMVWSEGVLSILAEVLAEKGLELVYRLSPKVRET